MPDILVSIFSRFYLVQLLALSVPFVLLVLLLTREPAAADETTQKPRPARAD